MLTVAYVRMDCIHYAKGTETCDLLVSFGGGQFARTPEKKVFLKMQTILLLKSKIVLLSKWEKSLCLGCQDFLKFWLAVISLGLLVGFGGGGCSSPGPLGAGCCWLLNSLLLLNQQWHAVAERGISLQIKMCNILNIFLPPPRKLCDNLCFKKCTNTYIWHFVEKCC